MTLDSVEDSKTIRKTLVLSIRFENVVEHSRVFQEVLENSKRSWNILKFSKNLISDIKLMFGSMQTRM